MNDMKVTWLNIRNYRCVCTKSIIIDILKCNHRSHSYNKYCDLIGQAGLGVIYSSKEILIETLE